MKQRNKWLLQLVPALLLMLLLITGCGGKEEETDTDADSLQTYVDQMAGKTIGVLKNYYCYDEIVSLFEKSEIVEFSSTEEIASALENGTIDAFVEDEISVLIFQEDTDNYAIMGKLWDSELGVAFPKTTQGENLCQQWNAYLQEANQDGTLEEMKSHWFSEATREEAVDLSKLTGENGTLVLGVSIDIGFPVLFSTGNQISGFEIDLAVGFCQKFGYGLTFEQYDFTNLFQAVSSGKCDFGAAGLTITEERSQLVQFSDPTFHTSVDLVTKGVVASEKEATEQARALAYAGQKIGVTSGSIHDQLAATYFPYSTVEYINSSTDLALALEAGRIGAYMVDEPVARLLAKTYEGQYIQSIVTPSPYAFLYPKNNSKGTELREQMNTFLAKIKANGTLEAIDGIWFGDDESKKTVDYASLTGENGTLNFATSSDVGAPFAYLADGEYVGYDVDIAVRFCREYGYKINIYDTGVSGVLAAVSSGRCDFGACSISVTDERKETVDFSDYNYEGSIVLMAKNRAETDVTFISDDSVYDEIRGEKIGVVQGSVQEEISHSVLPESETISYASSVAVAEALEQKEIAGYFIDQPLARLLLENYEDQHVLGVVSQESNGYLFQKNNLQSNLIRAQLNGYLKTIRQDGTMKEIDAIWFGNDEEAKKVSFQDLTWVNGTLYMAVSTDVGAPFCYVKDGNIVGYDIDIAVRFCAEYGYGLILVNGTFADIFTKVKSGECNFGGSCITVTDERKTAFNFSDANYDGGTVVVVRKADEFAITEISDKKTLESFRGTTIGVLSGTLFDTIAEKTLSDIQLQYYMSNTEVAVALQSGKIQGYIVDQPVARKLAQQFPQQHVGAILEIYDLAYVFPKDGEKTKLLCAQMNVFLEQLKNEGTLKELDSIWFGQDTSKQTVDYSVLTGENGTLKLAVNSGIGDPFCYMRDGIIVGYDIDIAARFCREYGYGLEVVDSTFDGLLASVSTGKCDFGASSIAITEERKESLAFSNPNYSGGAILMVLEETTIEEENFFASLLDSFNKTFLREGRWKLFIQGVAVTLIITVLSALFGTALGFGTFLIYRKKKRITNAIIFGCSEILQKTPVVVILMILYYIVFAKSALSGISVSIVGFTLIFACSVLALLKVSVDAVDPGQNEAVKALGFTDTHGFLTMILPQALRHFIPGYQGELVTLIKATAIVGYIAVQDLTKVSDIVRSRTYEAFFPLIASAIIYFLLAWLLTRLVKAIQIQTDPKHRSEARILKGVVKK